MEDAELKDRSDDLTLLTLHGAGASDLAQSIVAPVARGALDATGHGGVALLVPSASAATVAADLVARGALLDQGPQWVALRLDGLFPEFGVDYTSTDNPHEASLDRRAIAWDKGCYLGQEVVCMQDMRGKLKRRVVGIHLAGDAVPAPGTEVRSAASGEVVGLVTSAGRGERRGTPLALAMLKAPHFEPGQAVLVGEVQGTVLAHDGSSVHGA
jgi:folate-binding protein YgfZ